MYGATIGKTSVLGIEATTNQACAVGIPSLDLTSSGYLYHYLCSQRDAFVEAAKGGAQPNISQGMIKAWPFPLAPLSEQKRIVDKLDALRARVDACTQRLDRLPAIVKRFRDSVLAAATNGELTREWRAALGDDGRVRSFQLEDADTIRDYTFPASWSARRLSDIATISGGVTKDSKKQSADFTEMPYLRVANVQRGHLDLREVKTIRVPPDRVEELLLRVGDILFNEGGDIDKLGRGCVWNGELPACVFQNHVFRARLLDRAFEPRYFSWYGNSRGYQYFLARGKQTTNLASINKSVLSALPVAIPSAQEQAEIVRRVQDLFLLADRLEGKAAAATARVVALTPSTLAKAFRGDLVPQDPIDAPASTLLARMHAANTGRPLMERPKGRSNAPTRSLRAQKGSARMTKNRHDDEVREKPYLADILRRLGGTASAEELFRSAELPVTDFYKQLSWEVDNGHIRDGKTRLEVA